MKRIIFALITAVILNIHCFAVSPKENLADRFNINEIIEEIPYQAEDLIKEAIPDKLSIEEIIKLSPHQIKDIVVLKASQAFKEYKTQLVSILFAVILSAVLSAIGENGSENIVFELICAVSITLILLEPMLSCIKQSSETIREISKFMLLYIPVFSSVMITGGAMGSAAVYQTAVMAAAQILSQLSDKAFMPMMQSYLLVSVSGVIGGNKGIASIANAIKKIINWGLAAAVTAFTGILSIQSFISSAADSAAAKTIKLLAGSFVPIIGGAFSDALSAMQSSLKIIRASVGGFGIAAALLTFMPIIIKITVLRAVIYISKIAGEIVSAHRCSAILGCFSDLLSAITALLLAAMMIFIISTAVMINTSVIL